jgi:hypothetical protein
MRSFSFGKGTVGRWAALAVCVSLCGPASAANVVLKDGTVIHGKIESLRDGVYTVRTDSLGTVRVRQQQVRSIDESDGAAKAAQPAAPSKSHSAQAAVQQRLKSGISANPELLQLVLALQNDRQMQAVLADPNLMKEIAAGDYTALKNDPKIIALMRDENVRAILNDVR